MLKTTKGKGKLHGLTTAPSQKAVRGETGKKSENLNHKDSQSNKNSKAIANLSEGACACSAAAHLQGQDGQPPRYALILCRYHFHSHH